MSNLALVHLQDSQRQGLISGGGGGLVIFGEVRGLAGEVWRASSGKPLDCS